MNSLKSYEKYILIGQDKTARSIYNQLSKDGKQLVAVVDLSSAAKRKITHFNGLEVVNLNDYKKNHDISDVVFVVAVNDWFMSRILCEYKIEENQLFVLNPYVSLRTFMRSGEMLLDERIPFSDERYTQVGKLFQDELSRSIFRELINAVPWDSEDDNLDIKWYPEIKPLFYMSEDYWDTYQFDAVSSNLATVVDCGAYTGDSILKICRNIPQRVVNYYAFEPLHDNAQMIRNNIELKEGCLGLEVMECGVGDKNITALFKQDTQKAEGGRFVSDEIEATSRIEMRRLDDIGLNIAGQLYIKMDVEGAELEALHGASEMIRKYKPYCAICVYHRKNDLVSIPLYLKSLVPDYHFFLRGGYHTIVWAIPS